MKGQTPGFTLNVTDEAKLLAALETVSDAKFVCDVAFVCVPRSHQWYVQLIPREDPTIEIYPDLYLKATPSTLVTEGNDCGLSVLARVYPDGSSGGNLADCVVEITVTHDLEDVRPALGGEIQMFFVSSEDELEDYAGEAPGTMVAEYGFGHMWQLKPDGSWVTIL
jgi:hypothetical protein